MSSFTKKSSNYFVTVFIGFIILSFMFTGYQSMRSSPNSVAQVGPENVTLTEYRQEYSRQLEFYKGIFGGKNLTSKQIEQFNIKNNTLKNLVQRKLMLIFASKIGSNPSSNEIKAEIKNLPYFKTNDQFDISRYKALLSANSLTPTAFEKDISTQIKGRKAAEILQNFPVSKTYAKELHNFKNNKFSVNMVTLNKESLRKFIPVSTLEVGNFLKEKKNLERVTSLFNERKSTLEKPEQVEAQHILLKTDGKNDAKILKKIEGIRAKLTTKNFSKMANKYTEDPSGKKKGGKLPAFSRGRMVPAFDKVAFSNKPGTISRPVKTQFGYHIILVNKKIQAVKADLSKESKTLATELIRKNKNAELDKLVKDISSQVYKNLKNSKTKALNALRSKYLFSWQKNTVVNQLEGAKGVNIETANLQKVFSAKEKEVLQFNEATQVQIIMKMAYKTPKGEKKESLQDYRKSLQSQLAKSFTNSVIKEIEGSVTVTTQSNLL